MSRMPREKSDSKQNAIALCGAIALGALIAHNLPPPKSKARPRRQRRPPQQRSPTPSPPPSWRRVPHLIDQAHYQEERYYLRYGSGEEPGDVLCVVDQRPVDGSVRGPEAREETEEERRERGFEVERYYRLNGDEAGPDEAHRIVKRGYPKWDR